MLDNPPAYVQSYEAEAETSAAALQYVTKAGNVVRVGFKYNANFDMWIEFKPGGVNQLMALGNIYLIRNSAQEVDPNPAFPRAVTLTVTGSDWVGPYIMRAAVNGNGESPKFTGGWHGSNGDGTGKATARTVSWQVAADGKAFTEDGTIAAREVTVSVVNRIQAYNTKPTGDFPLREVVEERVQYAVRRGTVDVQVEIEALEDIVIERYYGLQSINSGHNGTIHYVNGDVQDRKKTPNASNDSGPLYKAPDVSRYALRSASRLHNLVVWLDRSFGLGDMKNVPVSLPAAFTASYGKSYFNLIRSDLPVAAGEKVAWRGGWIFSPGLPSPGDLAYIYHGKTPADDRLVIDFLAAGGEGYCTLPAEYSGKKVAVLSASPGVTAGEAVSADGKLWVRAEGYGSVVIAFQ
ncbi:MAG TPA: hypothetical protein GXX55_04595 [Firmicutes bacterium]|nr:hypothetical protein [Bacillota bacterium]